MPKLTKNELLLVGVEAAAGTEQALDANDYVRALDITAQPEGLRIIERDSVAAGSQGNFKPLYGGSHRSLSLGWEVAGGVGNDETPEHDALYQAVGLLKDATDANVVKYKLQSNVDSMKTVTVKYEQDGSYHHIKGARASAFSIEATTGETVRCQATIVGQEGTIGDGGNTDPRVSAAVPLVAVGATLSIDAITDLVVEKFSVDFGLDTQMSPDIIAADGYTRPRIVNRKISITVNPEKVDYGTANWWAKLKANDAIEVTLTVGAALPGGGGRMTIHIPRAVLSNRADADRSGIRTDELTLMPYRDGDTADDELELRFE